jgi:hypothetical protein
LYPGGKCLFGTLTAATVRHLVGSLVTLFGVG